MLTPLENTLRRWALHEIARADEQKREITRDTQPYLHGLADGKQVIAEVLLQALNTEDERNDDPNRKSP